MREKTDRRIVRTQQQLRAAMLALAEEKAIATITVKGLTERAGLNRGTFYLHYQGIEDFCEQLKEETLEDYHAIIKKLSYYIGSKEPFVDPPVGFLKPFEYIREHRDFFNIFMGPNSNDRFSQQMTELLQHQFQAAYLARRHPDEQADIPVQQLYLFAYLASAYVGSLQLWIQRDFDLSAREMAILFSKISRLGSANLSFEG